MKTERRHELQKNELADSLARVIETLKPYSRAAMAVLLAVVVLAFAWIYMGSQSSRREAQGWTEFFTAMSKRDPRDDLNDIATRYTGTPVAQWARLVLADIQLDNGTNRLFIEKKDAREELRQAAEKYRSVILESREPGTQQHATFGLARAHEALGTPESLEDARKEYRSIVTKWPDSAYAKTAEARAKDLDTLPTKDFYDWLAKYEPPKPMSKEPGTPGVRPDFLKEPLEGNLKLPSFDPTVPPQGSSLPSTDLPATGPDLTPATPPADEGPADKAPSDEPPAPSDSPGEPK